MADIYFSNFHCKYGLFLARIGHCPAYNTVAPSLNKQYCFATKSRRTWDGLTPVLNKVEKDTCTKEMGQKFLPEVSSTKAETHQLTLTLAQWVINPYNTPFI